MEKEQWKTIDGYENYMVSNLGRVKSVKRNIILKERPTKEGYVRVVLWKKCKGKNCFIHRLVAETFIPNPNKLRCVNHINEDKTDNRIENLEWCTHKYNSNYGTGIQRRIEQTCKSVIQFTIDGVKVAEYKSAMDAERQTGFPHQNIGKCCLGKYQKAYGYIWRYKEPAPNE